MQKAKLGISVGVLGAAIYFAGLVSGLLAMVLMVGYVLLFEENEWLRKSAVKAVALLMLFELANVVVGLIPDVLTTINHVMALWNDYFTAEMVSKVLVIITSLLDLLEKVLFILLGVKAFKQGTIAIPVVDDIVNKYM